MPTYGWIYEDAHDHAWWPTMAFPCQECGEICGSSAELSDHYGRCHPLALPAIYIHGAEAGREPVIRSLQGGLGLTTVAATRCEVALDGASLEGVLPSQLEDLLQSSPSSTAFVRLWNRRHADGAEVSSEYTIKMRVPDDSALVETDALFTELLARDSLGHEDIARFESALPKGVADREYGAALGDYAVGVLMKKSPDMLHAGIGFAEFQAKMKGALAVLGEFRRPLAHTVSNAIRFNLNGFSRPVDPILTRLDVALALMVALATGTTPATPHRSASEETGTTAVLPVDDVTGALVDAACSVTDESSELASLVAMRALEGDSRPVSEQDLRKAQVILAEGQLKAGRFEDARSTIERLQFDPTFRGWAERRLEEISERGE